MKQGSSSSLILKVFIDTAVHKIRQTNGPWVVPKAVRNRSNRHHRRQKYEAKLRQLAALVKHSTDVAVFTQCEKKALHWKENMGPRTTKEDHMLKFSPAMTVFLIHSSRRFDFRGNPQLGSRAT
jgi:hypothetical protein